MNLWLLELKIKFQKAQVKKALAELVAKGLILEKKGSNSQIHYRINQRKYKKVQELFKQKGG
jgi:DNA-binding GntR family transcriptional regulator